MKIHVWEIRNQKGLSLSDLADKAQVSRTHINDIENGVKSPTIETIYKLAVALEVRPEELYEC